MGYAYVPKNSAEVYEANSLHVEILRVAAIPAFQELEYTIWDPRQRKPFLWGWTCNDGQYVDAADAHNLGQALKEYLATPEARRNYAEYYENRYRHLSIRYDGPEPSRELLLADCSVCF